MEKINNIPGENPFRVPEKYFEEVNKKILASTSGTGIAARKPGLYFRLRPFLAVAATVAVLIIGGYSAVRLFTPGTENIETIPEIGLQEFADMHLNDIDIVMLEENASLSIFSEELPVISESEIIDYLLLENIDINEIYELL